MKFEVMWRETHTTTFLAYVEAEDEEEVTEMVNTESHNIAHHRDWGGETTEIEIISVR